MVAASNSTVSDVGTRHTRQREALVGLIAAASGPLSVPELMEMANAGGDKVGIATVYRTVKLLSESGKVRSVTLPDGGVRYERATLGHHHHFHCRKCDRVFDLDLCPVHLHAKDLPPGFAVESHEVTLVGLCADCGVKTKAHRNRETIQSPQSSGMVNRER
jgi:Fur family ferric uptake transcriptional regulator